MHATAPTVTHRTPTPTARPRAVLAVILVAYFMILMDNSVIFTGLPSIQAGLDLSPASLSWVQDAYTLVFGGLLLLGARAGDLLGRVRLFVAGLALFGLASLAIGLAQAGWWMVAGRAVQGVGAAVVAPTSLALITASFEGEARRRAVAAYAATAGIGASLGMVLGGALTEFVSWRAAFLVNVPIAVAMIVASRRVLAETPRTQGRFDLIGAVCATAGFGSLVLGLLESPGHGWGSPRVLGPLGLGVLLLVALVLHESRAAQPIMPLRLFRSRERSGAYAVRVLYLGGMIGFFYFTTQFLQHVYGFTALEAGLGFLPMTLVNFAVAMALPRISRRVPGGVLLPAGTALTLAGLFWLAQAGADASYLPAVGLPMAIVGFGQGLVFAPLTSAGIAGVEQADAGAASGLLNTAHQLGMALGLAVLVAVSAGAPTVARQFHQALTGAAVLVALALVVLPATNRRGRV
ncbi:MFS transporter [Kineosporia sp. J2-2]|uniref:MFS transporter n=1 Tax=Kineosporia corallincola TaxID=2835133 RepID=A0ABS5TRE4_9ACTN|nr:MFS transporter [Kineosporia corallincola]MBT0773369.1 MFS transporter [Kineosporia corallincola]